MFIKKLFVFVIATILLSGFAYSQSDIAVGGWKVYPNYSAGCDADIIDNQLFYASKSGVMRMDIQDNFMRPITKTDGLSDVGIQCLRADQNTKTVIICYSNSNIDIYQNGRITNIPDLYNKQMSGIKTIYSIFTHDKYAYLACGFGVVVLDLKKKVVSDSWIFRLNNQDYPVKDLLITQDGTIYAATDHALLKNKITNPNIKDFATWEIVNNINTPNNNNFNQLADLNDHLFLLKIDTTTTDTATAIYRYNNNLWEKDTSFRFDQQNAPRFTHLFIRPSADKLIVGSNFGINSYIINPSDNSIQPYYAYCEWCYNAVTAVHGKNNDIYIITSEHGIYRGGDGGQYYYDMMGPANGAVVAMDWKNGKLVAVHNSQKYWYPEYHQAYISSLQDNSWDVIRMHTSDDNVYDVMHVVIAPYDNSVVFATSFLQGLLEYRNDTLYKQYDYRNSTLDSINNGDGQVRTASPVFDKDNNLWIGNLGVNNPLSVHMKKDGKWKSFPIRFDGGIGSVEKILVDSRNILWLICEKETKLVLFNPNGTPDNTADDQWANLNISLTEEKGQFKYIYCIAEDKEKTGRIWLGTDHGLKYYSRTSGLFDNPNLSPEPIYVTKDSLTELLLNAESVRCLKIDGGNRKWIGTDNGGVYLLSADCREEILHFTTENSPLLSNTIHYIEIDGYTGEVYFGTENGLISFRYTATDPKEKYEELKIFPNPVRENYNGQISIEGLKEKSEVKITDVHGGMVYRTISNGGTAVWNGIRFDGQKAATGVYFVFVCDESGVERIAGKILFIK